MKAITAMLLLVASAGAWTQSAPTPVRIPVRHADPWLIKALLEGREVRTPEISTVAALMGMAAGPGGGAAAGAAGAGIPLFTGGRFVINPADNSLWWFPDRPRSE